MGCKLAEKLTSPSEFEEVTVRIMYEGNRMNDLTRVGVLLRLRDNV